MYVYSPQRRFCDESAYFACSSKSTTGCSPFKNKKSLHLILCVHIRRREGVLWQRNRTHTRRRQEEEYQGSESKIVDKVEGKIATAKRILCVSLSLSLSLSLFLSFSLSCAHTYTHTYTHIDDKEKSCHCQARTLSHTRTHTHARAHTHTHIHTHTHTLTHTHRRPEEENQGCAIKTFR